MVVYSSGKTISEPQISNSSAALVQQFYPSEQGGNALADVLYGTANQRGKLSVSVPYPPGTLLIHYNNLTSGRATNPGTITFKDTLVLGQQYVLSTLQPLHEFGYGLLYSNVSLDRTSVANSNVVTATVSVRNEGQMHGQEVVAGVRAGRD